MFPALLACTGAAVDSAVTILPDDTGESMPAAPSPFSPISMLPSIWAGFDGSELTTYTWEGVDSEPEVALQMVSEDWFITESEDETCSWSGILSAAGDIDLKLGTVFYQKQVELVLSETDCMGFDEDVWGMETPTAVLESTTIGMAISPLRTLEPLLSQLYGESGKDWELDGAPYVFEVTWMLPGSNEPEGWGYGVSFATDDDGNVKQKNGTPVKQTITNGLETGILFILPYRTLSVEDLPSTP